MNDIQKAIKGARAAQVGLIYNGFSNSQEVNSDDSILKCEDSDDIEKARSGVYEDTAENRKLGRVGQKYGEGKKFSNEDGNRVKSDKKSEDSNRVKSDKKSEDSNVNKEVVDRMRRAGFHANKKGDVFSDRDGDRRLKINEDGSVTWSQYDEDGKRFSKKFTNVDEALKNRWIEKESKSDKDVEKSDIFEALDSGNSIKISKTGSEIKTQVSEVILPSLNAELAVKKNEADEKLKCCGLAPTKTPEYYWTNGIKIDCGYLVYDWDETYISNDNGGKILFSLSAEDAAAKKGNIPENQEQANKRREYNDAVRAVCNIMLDIKACEILNSLKDESEYELTTRQITSLKF